MGYIPDNPVSNLAWSQGFLILGNIQKLFTEKQREGGKATSRLELLKCSLRKQYMVETRQIKWVQEEERNLNQDMKHFWDGLS